MPASVAVSSWPFAAMAFDIAIRSLSDASSALLGGPLPRRRALCRGGGRLRLCLLRLLGIAAEESIPQGLSVGGGPRVARNGRLSLQLLSALLLLQGLRLGLLLLPLRRFLRRALELVRDAAHGEAPCAVGALPPRRPIRREGDVRLADGGHAHEREERRRPH